MAGTEVTELENLNAMGITGSWGIRGQEAVLCCQGKVGVVTIIDISQSSNQNNLTCRNLWSWLVDHVVPRSEIDRKPTKLVLDLYKQKSSRLNEPNLMLIIKKRES